MTISASVKLRTYKGVIPC